SRWDAASSGQGGYVVSGDYWPERRGSYSVGVALAAQTTTNVELWDENDDRLVARQVVPPSAGPQEIEMPFQIGEYRRPVGSYAGWGPFRISPIPPPLDEVMEVRVWTPAHGEVSVYSITMRRTGTASAP
ncbi:MAG TPA: hypothetical protein VL961_00005, partial [Acidimicrobiales bacterium]|nr:hypothetical protein [Acidimicrobiales bacterium]